MSGSAEPSTAGPSTDDENTGAPSEVTDRVHHHARTSHDELVPPGSIRTLCGLLLSGPRPEAASLPCCAMCAAEMESLGHRCRR